MLPKFDPYINVDHGTMNPYQHGEVFVTEDRAETDLDLGHYERFLDENLGKALQHDHGKCLLGGHNPREAGIGIHDPEANLVHFPYSIERGVRYPDEPIPLRSFRRLVVETGKSRGSARPSSTLISRPARR